MGVKIWVLAAALVATACATEPTDDDGGYDADPSDFDSKADGISGTSQKVLAFIDGAQQRLYVQLPTLADKTLLTHLKSAVTRGVDVHAYVVVPHAAHAATVLAEAQLEASGVDVFVERTTHLPGFLGIADARMLTSTSGATTSTGVAAAATKFTTVIAEDTSGTASGLILEPDAGIGPIVSRLAGAQSSIDLEIYQLQSPAAIAALVAAKQRGVTVHVMLEPKTVGYQNFKPVSAQLQGAGITVKTTPPAFDSSHNVDHAKFMIVDGKTLVFGSGNLVRTGTGGNTAREFTNRDFWIEDARATAVAEAQRVFDADWNRTSTTSGEFTQLVLSPDNANDRIAALIDGATSRLYVYNQSLDDDDVQTALARAKARGVDVHVLLGLQPGFGGAPPANQPAIDDLTAKGVTAGYFSRHYLHGKVVVADRKAFVGSQNFTAGGLVRNRELGEVVTTPTIVDALATTFLADEAHPEP